MKLGKSALLGSAASLIVVAGAQAADLPVRAAAPVVEYVRVCPAYGAGFFFIPGTETCLRISGRVRAEYRYVDPETRVGDALGWRARGQLNLDARTATAWGTLRTFIRYELTRNSGNYGVVQQQWAGQAGQALTVDLNKAFIQFAGITAGRATSFFDFYANALNWGNFVGTGSDTYGNDPVVLAYTATFGGGFSATISLEDPASRRVTTGVLPPVPGTPGAFALPPGVVLPFITAGAAGTTAPGQFFFAGQRMPEIVGNVRVDQAWGSAFLSGALHQLISSNLLVPNPAGPFALGPRVIPETKYGFAITGGLKLNLPFIAPGDVLWLQATYADGAMSYLGHGNARALQQGGQSPLVGNFADAFVDPFGRTRTVTGWNIHAAFLHYWTPQLRSAFFGTYGAIDVPAFANSALIVPPLAPAGTPAFVLPGNFVADLRMWQVGANLIWSPVRDLDIGVEVLYGSIRADRRVVDLTSSFISPGVGVVGAPFVRTIRGDDSLDARLRIQRDF